MVELRVTKYDPRLRNALGYFVGDDWTSVSDIGRAFGGRVLTLEGYLATEDTHVAVVRECLDRAGVGELTIDGLEPGCCDHLPASLKPECAASLPTVRNGRRVSGEDLARICRLVLREVMWCRLVGDRGFYIHFGYDYYMYIGFDGDASTLTLDAHGLYIDYDFPSPYMPDTE